MRPTAAMCPPPNGRRSWHRTVLSVGCAVALSVAPLSNARAQFGIGLGPMPVVDATAIARLASQLATARDQLSAFRSNMEKLGRYDVRDVRATLSQIDVITQQGEAISYSLANLERVVNETFPGGTPSVTIASDMRRQDDRTLATVRAAIAASRVTAEQFATEAAKLEAIKGQLRGIRSAQQAAELSGLVGVHTAEELTLLRQQLAAQGNAQTVYLAYQANRSAQAGAVAAAFDSLGARRPSVRLRADVRALGFEP